MTEVFYKAEEFGKERIMDVILKSPRPQGFDGQACGKQAQQDEEERT